MTSTAESRALGAFRDRFGADAELVACAPGRVNLIGEHVDYNEGYVLPTAIDRAAWVAASPVDDGTITIEAVDFGERVRFDLESAGARSDSDGRPLPHWALYAAGVARMLALDGHRVAGLRATLASDVPVGAGLSSSAAVQVVLAATWRALGDLAIDRMALALLCQRSECEYVGVRCGLMDPFVSIHGEREHALWLDCRTLDWRPVRLPAATVVVIADSKVRRELAASEFNVRRAECERAVERLRAVVPDIRSLRDVSPEMLAAYADRLPEPLARRARHVVEEIARVAAVIPEIERGDARALGGAMTAAHQSGRHLYEVSCRELDVLVDTAVTLPGCHGARLTGAGFGGCTVSLVAADAVDEFVKRLTEAYRAETGLTADVWVCRAADGARVERVSAPR
jgi:galactokinase